MRFYLIAMLIAASVTFFATIIVIKFGQKYTRNELRSRDVHTKPIPRIGGLAMLCGVLASLAVCYFIPAFSLEYAESNKIQAIAVAVVILGLVGFLDDLINLDWMLKLSAQIVSAIIVVLNGVQILSLPISGLTVGSNRVSMVLTVIVIVAVVNAVNFIDGLDGLAAGIILTSSLSFLFYSWQLLSVQHNYAVGASLIAAILSGICLGFLPHNINPAKIFMGDTGSQILGLLLACSVLLVTGRIDPVSANIHSMPAFMPIIMPFLVCVLPLFDMCFAILRRLLSGKSPFSPDRKHLHHRLLDLGHSHRGTVALLWFWSALFSFGSFLYVWFSGTMATIILGIAAFIILVATFAPKLFIKPIFDDAEVLYSGHHSDEVDLESD